MAARKSTAQAAKQPEAKEPADQPEVSHASDSGNTAPQGNEPAPAAVESNPDEVGKSKDDEPAKDGTQSDDEQSLPDDLVSLEVVTRLSRRIRGGVTVTQEPQTVTVTAEVAELIEADPHISATRK